MGRADQRAPIHHWSLLFLSALSPIFRPSRSVLGILLSFLSPTSQSHSLAISSKYGNIQISVWTWGAIERGESPLIRRTKSQRIPLNDSFVHPITFRYCINLSCIGGRDKEEERKEGRRSSSLEIADELCWKNSTSRTRLCARLNARKNFPLGYFQSYKLTIYPM